MIIEYQKHQAHVQWWVGQYSFEQYRVSGDGGEFVEPEATASKNVLFTISTGQLMNTL